MQRRNMRVIIASAHPMVRHLVKEMVEDETGITIVGQAENAARTISLTRRLRPDVAIIDSHLPYKKLLETVPLSQIGGLDAAQTTFAEIPNIRVVLLNTNTASPESIPIGNVVRFSREKEGGNSPFKLQELYKNTDADKLIFASLQTQPGSTKGKITAIANKAILYGAFGLLFGFILILTVILAAPGFFVAIIAAATLILGAATKLVSRLWFRMSRPGDDGQPVPGNGW